MSKLEFQLGDISPAWCEPETSHKEMDAGLAVAICRVVNRRLAEMLAECPEVFQARGQRGHSWCWMSRHKVKPGEGEARARLVNVERIDGK